jgi:hypothetical protein
MERRKENEKTLAIYNTPDNPTLRNVLNNAAH